MTAAVLLALVAACVSAVGIWAHRRYRYDCGYPGCDQPHNRYHSHAGWPR
jgi:hypothetical protein